MAKILVTGAFGQIGSELTRALREKYGAGEVIATGRQLPDNDSALRNEGPLAEIDVTDADQVDEAVRQYDPASHDS